MAGFRRLSSYFFFQATTFSFLISNSHSFVCRSLALSASISAAVFSKLNNSNVAFWNNWAYFWASTVKALGCKGFVRLAACLEWALW